MSRPEFENKKVVIVDKWDIKHRGKIISTSGSFVLQLPTGMTMTFTEPKKQIKEIFVKWEAPQIN